MNNSDQLIAQVNIFNRLVESFNKDLKQVLTPDSSQEIAKPEKNTKQTSSVVSAKKEIVKEKVVEPTVDATGSVLDKWGDVRMSPHFLKVAQYFGVNWEEMPSAENKLKTIIRWAEPQVKSKDPMDIMRFVANASKKMPSAGYQEKPYNVLYRHIKLGV